MTTFTARQLPWMKIGHVIDDPDVDAEQAAKLGGLDFDVELRELAFADHDSDEWIAFENRRAVVRLDTGQPLSVCSTDYQVVQYREAFSFMDTINPRYVAAGTMSGGRQGFMVVQLPNAEHVDFDILGENDPHDMYVVLRTSHDQSKSIEVALMSLRGRCMNQLTLPTLMKDAPQHWGVRHVGNPMEKLKEAQRVLTRLPRYAEVIAGRAKQLASVEVTEQEFRPIMKRVLRPSLAKRDEMVDAIIGMHDRPTVGFQGTGWGWLNTVSEYFQWGRDSARRTDQSIFTDSLDGDGAKYTNKVMTALLSRA